MVAKIALKLVSWMETEKMIGKNEKVYYEYALITMIERIITIGTVLLVGMVFRQVIPTICFLVFFLSLRKRTGGYHSMAVVVYLIISVISFWRIKSGFAKHQVEN